jgi:hypothetical protein
LGKQKHKAGTFVRLALRLLDAFLGRPNAAEEHLKVRLR